MSHTLDEWIDLVSDDGWQWYVKYLAGNDTLLTKAHQAGPYIPKAFAFEVFPSIVREDLMNPRATITALIDSHDDQGKPAMIWYNRKTRNECHFTGWGGSKSKLLDPDNTGALTVFAFYRHEGSDAELCRIWIARDLDEEEAILGRVGPVEPGRGVTFRAGVYLPRDQRAEERPRDASCMLTAGQIPNEWFYTWPNVATVVKLAIDRLPTSSEDPPDKRLIRRHDCETGIFYSIESAVVLPRIKEGFASVKLFTDLASTVLNRRKSRHGASLELHARAIFDEEGVPYSHGEESEHGKRPDFLFPSASAYQDGQWPVERLRMLAVKTTCKDRWRQVIDEAERLPTKHLLTLQQGVSPKQYAQMKAAGVVLVVPKPIHENYHEDIRPELWSLEKFIGSTRSACSLTIP
ncbi:MAG: Type-2 restriction enzyme EcoRII [Gemmatimonadaceae bacterium]|nr:Type-2 restriction enzyme EcoRII [Gemmatimonadaceae bacterium]